MKDEKAEAARQAERGRQAVKEMGKALRVPESDKGKSEK